MKLTLFAVAIVGLILTITSRPEVIKGFETNLPELKVDVVAEFDQADTFNTDTTQELKDIDWDKIDLELKLYDWLKPDTGIETMLALNEL